LVKRCVGHGSKGGRPAVADIGANIKAGLSIWRAVGGSRTALCNIRRFQAGSGQYSNAHEMAHTCAIPGDARLPGRIQCLRAAIPPRPTRIRPYGLVASLRALVFHLRGSIALRHESCSTKTSPLCGRRDQSACLNMSRASSDQSKCAWSLARPCHSILEACAVFLAGLITTSSGALWNAQVGRNPGSRRARPARTWRNRAPSCPAGHSPARSLEFVVNRFAACRASFPTSDSPAQLSDAEHNVGGARLRLIGRGGVGSAIVAHGPLPAWD